MYENKISLEVLYLRFLHRTHSATYDGSASQT